MKITERQLRTLKALEKVSRGNPTTFVNWANADALVALGLAQYFGTGKYAITEKGRAVLQE